MPPRHHRHDDGVLPQKSAFRVPRWYDYLSTRTNGDDELDVIWHIFIFLLHIAYSCITYKYELV